MDLAFGPSSASSAGEPTYSLLMLPAGIGTALEIRGSSSAVLVTPDQSYILLATQHSNSLLLLLPDDERGTVTSNLHETLELQRVWPALGNLPALLVDTDYAGEVLPGGETRLSWPELRELLPASDAEIQQALTRLRVLHIGGRLRLLSQSFLVDILSRLLESLDLPASLATEDAVPVVELSKGKRKRDPVKPVVAPVATTVTVNLSDSNVEDWFDLVDLSETVGLDVLAWYGNRTTGTWVLDVESIVREVGLGVLAQGGFSPQPLERFMERWRAAVAPFSMLALPSLLSHSSLLLASSVPPSILYFPPTHLSPDPATRFTELFAQKPRWSEQEMVPFLNDLVGGEKKGREKMVLRFVRKVKSPGGDYWTARNLW